MHENNFKFGVYQDKKVLVERIFSADQLNPFTRYSVDIRVLIPDILEQLVDVFQRDDVSFSYLNYDFKNFNESEINKYEKNVRSDFKYNPKTNKFGSVDLNFGLYINDKPIVEREFYVKEFNPEVIHSIDLINLITFICEDIIEHLKLKDVRHMWEDYDIINHYNYNIQQVRSIPENKRRSMLKKIRSFC